MRAGRAKLTDQIVQELNFHKARTGIGQFALLSGRRSDLPAGLNSATLGRWLNGQAQTAKASQLSYVLQLWRSLPDYQKPVPTATSKQSEPKYGNVALSAEVLAQLRAHRDMGFLPRAIFLLPETPPTGFDPAYISRWLNGQAASAKREYLEFVLRQCQALESHPRRPVVITEQLWVKLSKLKDQSGLGPKTLLAKAEGVPEGLNAGLIAGWLSRTTKTARLDHWEFVLEQYRANTRKPA